MFNKFKSLTCELANNQCANYHICTSALSAKNELAKHAIISHKVTGHFNESKGNKYQGQAHVASNPSFSGQGSGDGDHSRPCSSPTEPSSNPQLTIVLSNMQQS